MIFMMVVSLMLKKPHRCLDDIYISLIIYTQWFDNFIDENSVEFFITTSISFMYLDAQLWVSTDYHIPFEFIVSRTMT